MGCWADSRSGFAAEFGFGFRFESELELGSLRLSLSLLGRLRARMQCRGGPHSNLEPRTRTAMDVARHGRECTHTRREQFVPPPPLRSCGRLRAASAAQSSCSCCATLRLSYTSTPLGVLAPLSSSSSSSRMQLGLLCCTAQVLGAPAAHCSRSIDLINLRPLRSGAASVGQRSANGCATIVVHSLYLAVARATRAAPNNRRRSRAHTFVTHWHGS